MKLGWELINTCPKEVGKEYTLGFIDNKDIIWISKQIYNGEFKTISHSGDTLLNKEENEYNVLESLPTLWRK